MRQALLAHLDARAGEGLSPVVLRAVQAHRDTRRCGHRAQDAEGATPVARPSSKPGRRRPRRAKGARARGANKIACD
jgi:hypothetical protein